MAGTFQKASAGGSVTALTASALTGLTPGQVLFGGSNGAPAQTDRLQFDSANSRLGIGSIPSGPTERLQISSGSLSFVGTNIGPGLTDGISGGQSKLQFWIGGNSKMYLDANALNGGSNSGQDLYIQSNPSLNGHIFFGRAGSQGANNGVLYDETSDSIGVRTGYADISGALDVKGRFEETKGADVASAGTLTLGTDGNFFSVTGNTTVNYITTTGWRSGARVELYFPSAITLTNLAGSVPAGAANLKLAAGLTVALASGSSISLRYDRPNAWWREVGRVVG